MLFRMYNQHEQEVILSILLHPCRVVVIVIVSFGPFHFASCAPPVSTKTDEDEITRGQNNEDETKTIRTI